MTKPARDIAVGLTGALAAGFDAVCNETAFRAGQKQAVADMQSRKIRGQLSRAVALAALAHAQGGPSAVAAIVKSLYPEYSRLRTERTSAADVISHFMGYVSTCEGVIDAVTNNLALQFSADALDPGRVTISVKAIEPGSGQDPS